jgi:hypothetical protein
VGLGQLKYDIPNEAKEALTTSFESVRAKRRDLGFFVICRKDPKELPWLIISRDSTIGSAKAKARSVGPANDYSLSRSASGTLVIEGKTLRFVVEVSSIPKLAANLTLYWPAAMRKASKGDSGVPELGKLAMLLKKAIVVEGGEVQTVEEVDEEPETVDEAELEEILGPDLEETRKAVQQQLHDLLEESEPPSKEDAEELLKKLGSMGLDGLGSPEVVLDYLKTAYSRVVSSDKLEVGQTVDGQGLLLDMALTYGDIVKAQTRATNLTVDARLYNDQIGALESEYEGATTDEERQAVLQRAQDFARLRDGAREKARAYWQQAGELLAALKDALQKLGEG